MGPEYIFVLALVCFLSVIQSIFGLGILVFGTPTLLLAGYDFISAIGYLVPASFVISLLQVINNRSSQKKISWHLYAICLPAIGIGLWIVQGTDMGSWLHYLIGVTLIIAATLRLKGSPPMALSSFLQTYSPAYHFVMGMVHGLTNLGGALLTILASNVHKDKEDVRRTVAHYYLAFVIIQILLLVILFEQGEELLNNLPIALAAGAIFLLVGNRLFLKTSNPFYHHGLTALTFAYGIAVLVAI